MKNIILVVLLMIGFTTLAQTKKNKNAKYTIEVNGNCEQSQKRIQKAALSVSGVKLANWDVDTHQLNVILNEEKCSIIDVEKAIAIAGHDTQEIKATKEAYNNLHSYCKYEKK